MLPTQEPRFDPQHVKEKQKSSGHVFFFLLYALVFSCLHVCVRVLLILGINLGPMEVQSVLSTAEPCLHPYGDLLLEGLPPPLKFSLLELLFEYL